MTWPRLIECAELLDPSSSFLGLISFSAPSVSVCVKLGVSRLKLSNCDKPPSTDPKSKPYALSSQAPSKFNPSTPKG